MRRTGRCAGFDEMNADRSIKQAVSRSSSAQDVGRQPSVAGACLHEIKDLWGFGIGDWGLGCRWWGLVSEDLEHLLELQFEQFTEERSDVDARKKIARAARSLGGAGVVT